MSQQLIQHVSGIATPLGIATAYHVYNQTRSKALITLNNRLGTGISCDTLQRQLTSQCATIMQQIDQDGVYIPENMSHNQGIQHVFAMDNLDWKRKTLEGGTFNATTAIIVENIVSVTCDEAARRFSDVSIPVATSCRRKTLSCISNTTIPVCYISARDRQTSRNLTNIERVGMLDTTSDNSAEQLLLIWRLGRCVVTSQLLHVPYEDDVTLPGFSAFCARQLEHKQACKIGYLPLIPASPTDPAVLKEEMARLVKISHALGDTWTVITGDQATYELALTIRDKHRDEFSKVNEFRVFAWRYYFGGGERNHLYFRSAVVYSNIFCFLNNK